jgi:RNA polymerase sigma-70 factor (ECF subfamily)
MCIALAHPALAHSGRIRRMSADATDRASEPSILRKIARGDQGATQECIDRYGGLVWSLARRLSSTDSDAEDAVQDIFLDVWKSAERFDPSVASETTFVATIARRRLIDRRRREGRRIDTQALIEGATDTPDWNAPADSDSAEMAEDVAAARRAMAQLSPEQQRVLQLSIFQGLSHERIARATQIPLGTVKTHARRGLIRVRELIAQDRARASDADGGRP